MKIQKTLLYGLAVLGGIAVIVYLTKGKKGAVMASGGGVASTPPVSVTPPVAPVMPVV